MRLNYIDNVDCLEGMRSIPDESVDLIVTDPPYLCDYARHDSASRFNKKIANDENTAENEALICQYLRECFRLSRPDTAIYCFCNYKKIDFFKDQLERAGYRLKNIIVWDKQRNGMGDLKSTFGYSHEFILFGSKGNPKIRGKRIPDVWRFPRVPSAKQVHQNQKPLELIELCIEKSSDSGCVVFDGFMGSGTTAVACIRTGRNYIGFELDDKYHAIAQGRIAEEQEVEAWMY